MLKTSFIMTSNLEMYLCVHLILINILWQSLFPFLSLSEKNSVVKKDHKTNHTFSTYRISDFGTARKVKMIEASMTMTIGVGTPFYMAPEIISNVKHYTGAVDVYSFGIMAAQVNVGKLIFDIDEYNADCCLFFYHIMLIICVLSSLMLIWNHTAFYFEVCNGLHPKLTGCSTEMKNLIVSCWDANPSSRPCLSFLFSFMFTYLFHD